MSRTGPSAPGTPVTPDTSVTPGTVKTPSSPLPVSPPEGVVPLKPRPISFAAKRAIDLVVGSLLLMLVSPVLGAIALAIVIETGRPVFFVQWRAGREGFPFRALKFRTMRTDADTTRADFYLTREDPRITRTGRFLRRWALDELPQLVNVVKGDMSLVGPRPTLLDQVAKYDPQQWRRLLVKPGLTGWAQVNGRNAIEWAERIEFDVYYVDHFSLWLDLKCLVRTFGAVASPEGVYGRDGVNRGF